MQNKQVKGILVEYIPVTEESKLKQIGDTNKLFIFSEQMSIKNNTRFRQSYICSAILRGAIIICSRRP